MTTESATARPWEIQKRGDGLYYEIQYKREDGVMISVQDLGYITGRRHNLANAKLIVKCVNAHDSLQRKADMFDELVFSLHGIADLYLSYGHIDIASIRRILEEAEGKPNDTKA